MKIFTLLMCLFLTACTISVNTVHTQGTASDVVDEDQKADADVSPTVDLPMSP